MKALQHRWWVLYPTIGKTHGMCCSMTYFIGCDAHKKYSLFVAVDEAGETKPAIRVNHDRESYRTFLRGLPGRSSIAVETVGTGTGSWMRCSKPRINHGWHTPETRPVEQDDKLDARGLATLLRNGTLPEVWIPSRELRDQRELLRLRMTLVGTKTRGALLGRRRL